MTTKNMAVAGSDEPVQRSDEIDRGMFVLASLGQADDDHALVSGVLAGGLFIPLHAHDDVECLHVTEGSLDVYVGNRGRWFTVRGGQSIVIDPGVPHAIRNRTDRPVSTMVVMTVRLARFLRELGAVAAAAGQERSREERMRSLHALAERYGYWNAPPEQSEAIRNLPAFSA